MIKLGQGHSRASISGKMETMKELLQNYSNQMVVLRANKGLSLQIYPIQTHHPKPTKATGQRYNISHNHQKGYLFTNYLAQQNTNNNLQPNTNNLQQQSIIQRIHHKQQRIQPNQKPMQTFNNSNYNVKGVTMYKQQKENTNSKQTIRNQYAQHHRNLSPMHRKNKANIPYYCTPSTYNQQYQYIKESVQSIKMPHSNLPLQVKEQLNVKFQHIKQQVLQKLQRQNNPTVNINCIVTELQNAAKNIIDRYSHQLSNAHPPYRNTQNNRTLSNRTQDNRTLNNRTQDNRTLSNRTQENRILSNRTQNNASFGSSEPIHGVDLNTKLSFSVSEPIIQTDKENLESLQLQMPTLAPAGQSPAYNLPVNSRCTETEEHIQPQPAESIMTTVQKEYESARGLHSSNQDLYSVSQGLQDQYYVKYNIKFVDKRKTQVIRLSPLKFRPKQEITEYSANTELRQC